MMKKISTLCGFDLAELPSRKPSSSDQHTDAESQPPTQNGRKSDHDDLFNAAIKGDWKTAEEILNRNPGCATDTITIRGETVVHIAAAGKSVLFLREVVNMVDKSELERRNGFGCTAFYLAVLSGVVEKAKIMIEKNEKVLTIRCFGWNPIHTAAWKGHKKMVTYLYNTIPFEILLEKDRIDLLEATIRNDMYDVASDILEKDKRLATTQMKRRPKWNRTFLHVLARKTIAKTTAVPAMIIIQDKSLLARKLLGQIWNEYLEFPENKLMEIIQKTEILHYAAELGNAEFLTMLLNRKPNLLWVLNKDEQSFFHVAVLHRQKQVLDLIYTYGSFKDSICIKYDKDKNNMLHLCAKLRRTITSYSSNESTTDDANSQQPRDGKFSKLKSGLGIPDMEMPNSLLEISGPALKLQRELLWFMEVGKIMSPYQHKFRNNDKKTPKQIFSEDHRELLEEGEKWMKDTASSGMIVATLIATVVFAAAFTVPGGNNGDTGIPILIKQSSFTAFMISDAVSVFSSLVSILMFLSILISRYRQDDFLVSLPLKLLFGLTTLFVSIVGMLVVFALAFSLIFNKAWQPKLIIASIVAPFVLILLANFKLWFDAIKSVLLVLSIQVGSFIKLQLG